MWFSVFNFICDTNQNISVAVTYFSWHLSPRYSGIFSFLSFFSYWTFKSIPDENIYDQMRTWNVLQSSNLYGHIFHWRVFLRQYHIWDLRCLIMVFVATWFLYWKYILSTFAFSTTKAFKQCVISFLLEMDVTAGSVKSFASKLHEFATLSFEFHVERYFYLKKQALSALKIFCFKPPQTTCCIFTLYNV